ncbi:MAG: type III-A CRISPR-associated protein Csm2 [Prevotella sp.]|nr:type III-A CRISPR-associated protein Csm2 [Prevotella sp.]MDY5088441.1 type III-A CRISPR-associated protein Csm2 [Prevotella sp.]
MPDYNNSNGYGQRWNGNQNKNDNKPKIDAKEEAAKIFAKNKFLVSWIENGADEALPDYAEFIGKAMADNKLTSSKIRSVYGEIKRIQMGEFAKEKASFYLLRPKVAYAVGRDKENIGLQLFKLVFDKSAKCVKDKDTFLHFANFMEAVLAYHRAYVKKND